MRQYRRAVSPFKRNRMRTAKEPSVVPGTQAESVVCFGSCASGVTGPSTSSEWLHPARHAVEEKGCHLTGFVSHYARQRKRRGLAMGGRELAQSISHRVAAALSMMLKPSGECLPEASPSLPRKGGFSGTEGRSTTTEQERLGGFRDASRFCAGARRSGW